MIACMVAAVPCLVKLAATRTHELEQDQRCMVSVGRLSLAPLPATNPATPVVASATTPWGSRSTLAWNLLRRPKHEWLLICNKLSSKVRAIAPCLPLVEPWGLHPTPFPLLDAPLP